MNRIKTAILLFLVACTGGGLDSGGTAARLPATVTGELTLNVNRSGNAFTHRVTFESSTRSRCTLPSCAWAMHVFGYMYDDDNSDGTWDWADEPQDSYMEYLSAYSGYQVITFLEPLSETYVAGDYFEVVWSSDTDATIAMLPPSVELCEGVETPAGDTCDWTGWIEVAY